jgi:hypothetical protein
VRKTLSHYVLEITIVLLGAIVAMFEAIFASGNIALIVGFVACLISLAVVAIRQEIATQVGDTIEDRALLRSIPDERWRVEAELNLEQSRLRYSSWADGTRRVDRETSLQYEVELLGSAATMVRAIHLIEDAEAINMWIDPQKKFRALVEAYKRLPERVDSKRILVVSNETNPISVVRDGYHVIEDHQALAFCQAQGDPRPQGLGFSLRIVWKPRSDREIADLLVVDDRETCSIESYGHGEFGHLEASVNASHVQKQIRVFEDLWTSATPIELCLPS